MKILKILFAFVIFYFLVTMFNGMISLAKLISGDSRIIEIGFYCLIGVLVLVYLVWPIIKYTSIPSTKLILRMHEGDMRATRRLYRYYSKNAEIVSAPKDNQVEMRNSVIRHMATQITGFDKEIHKTAFKLTASVVISPNSFIDGLIIILGNSQMLYKLSKQFGIRYRAGEIFNMYFKVFSVASVSGIIQEFDDEIEDFLREMAEVISKETGKKIPFANIAISAVSPLIQASTNYAFVVYNGMRYKYRMNKLVENNGDSDRDIIRQARKDARRSRIKYFNDMVGRFKGKKKRSDPGEPVPAV
ncbi:MAG: hypothetical protein R3232_11940 [Clostridia bacterium]|nr:hypothetical protein [Clostridia bacterium]